MYDHVYINTMMMLFVVFCIFSPLAYIVKEAAVKW